MEEEREMLTSEEEEALRSCGYYHGQLWRTAAEDLVSASGRSGSFLLRQLLLPNPPPARSHRIELIITCLTFPSGPSASAELLHHRLQTDYRGYFTADGELFFRTVQDLVSQHHQSRRPVNPDYRGALIDFPVLRPPWHILPSQLKSLHSLPSRYGHHFASALLWKRPAPDTTATKVEIASLTLLSPDLKRLFLNDAATLLALKPHPNIIRLYGVCLLSDSLRVAKELSPCGSLRDLLADARSPIALVPHRASLSYQVFNAVAFLASCGIIHLGIASTTFQVFPLAAAPGWRLQLGRFFWAHSGQEVHLGAAHRGLPLRWSSPEVLKGGGETGTGRADVWSGAVVVWELHTEGGALPYSELAESTELGSQLLAALLEGVRLPLGQHSFSSRLKALLADAWDIQPRKRPSAAAAKTALEAILAHHHSKAHASSIL